LRHVIGWTHAATTRIREYERQHLSGREVPIVAMTAFSLPEDQEKCLEHGMNDYISKPFTKERFRDKVSLSASFKTPSNHGQ
jgi:CheY-like chemotaxis protein